MYIQELLQLCDDVIINFFIVIIIILVNPATVCGSMLCFLKS